MNQDINMKFKNDGFPLFLDGYKFWVDDNLELWCFINAF